VSVKDGETIVLGGIMRTTVTARTNKVPILGDIPILGELFKSRDNQKNKTELMVFLTPRIVRDEAQSRGLTEQERNRLSPGSRQAIDSSRPAPVPTQPGTAPATPPKDPPARKGTDKKSGGTIR
jgi:general secretion pathway protein D